MEENIVYDKWINDEMNEMFIETEKLKGEQNDYPNETKELMMEYKN